ncbi:DNA-binding response regulator [Aliidiomarina iranensis]|uniref:DNA-binding response regulator n=1 Tax=Aliidiomarina iranensis TaxID=1434071 RepID=A0A432W0V4_9GAMM|nr:response regulator transcription factor [Aliidiomarina iranensis]RUO22647.1 DNA-binding response regulator [Aliidiomarina iranensis]
MRVLLIEDHPSLSEAMVHAIARAGYAVDHAATVKLASQMAEITDYALIILDLGLPDGDGLELLPKLRKQGSVPVIILTAREELSARLAGLDGGADDYIVKPVEMSELLARCRAVLRRPGERASSTLTIDGLQLNTASRSVTFEKQPISLGRREVTVLEHLMRAAGRVLNRRTLEEAVYGFDDAYSPNALEASVSRLRRALAEAGCELAIITVRGVGWMLPQKNTSK